MPGGPLEVGYGVSYLSIAIPVPRCASAVAMCGSHQPSPDHLSARRDVAAVWAFFQIAHSQRP